MSAKTKRKPKIDLRKPLFNDGKTGPIKKIQRSLEGITKLNGILFDIDLPLLRKSSFFSVPKDPVAFYKKSLLPMLSRHPVLDQAEVRLSGRGLHVISWLDEPVEFSSDQEREKWAGIVQVVQSALPTDPRAPGITAVTRAVGSINSKNGVKVKKLRNGSRVSTTDVLDLYEAMCEAPFKTVANILSGENRITPCPFCKEDGTELCALDHIGKCYRCGKATLDQLYGAVFRPLTNGSKKAKRKGAKANVRKPK